MRCIINNYVKIFKEETLKEIINNHPANINSKEEDNNNNSFFEENEIIFIDENNNVKFKNISIDSEEYNKY